MAKYEPFLFNFVWAYYLPIHWLSEHSLEAVVTLPASHALSRRVDDKKLNKTVTIGAYPDELSPFGAFELTLPLFRHFCRFSILIWLFISSF